jgi:hypothetical protein
VVASGPMPVEETSSFELLTFIDIGRTACTLPVSSVAEAVEAIRGWHLKSLQADATPGRWSDLDVRSTVSRLRRAIDAVPALIAPHTPKALQGFADAVSAALEKELAVPINDAERYLLAYYDLRFLVRAGASKLPA